MGERKTIAIIGASADRSKFGNKAVRAYKEMGYEVYPINPKETLVEGLTAYKSVLDVPTQIDRVSVYVPPAIGLQLIADICRKGCRELWLNPGSESEELVARARALGLNVVQACSILAVGQNPDTI